MDTNKIIGFVKSKLYDSSGNAIDSELVSSQRALIVKDVGGGSGDTATETTLFSVKWYLEKLLGFFHRIIDNKFQSLNVLVKNNSSDPVVAQVDTVGEVTKLSSISDTTGYDLNHLQNRLTMLKYYESMGV